MEIPVRAGEGLDGLDARPVGLDGEHHAGLDRQAVLDDGARAAVSGVAADMGAGEIRVLANEVDGGPPCLDLPLVELAVDLDRNDHRRSAWSIAPMTART